MREKTVSFRVPIDILYLGGNIMETIPNNKEELEKVLTEIFSDLGSGKTSVIDFLQSDLFKTLQLAIKKLPKEKKVHVMNVLGLQIQYNGNITNDKLEAVGKTIGSFGKGIVNGFKGFGKAFKETQSE